MSGYRATALTPSSFPSLIDPPSVPLIDPPPVPLGRFLFRPPWEIPLPSPLGDPPPVPLLIPLPSPFKRGRPKDASLLVPWGRPDVAGVFCSMGEARGCGSFLFHGGKRAKRSPEGGYKAQTLTNLAC